MKKIILSLLALTTVSLSAQAGLPEDFAAMNQQSKGPFGMNILQGPNSRATINGGNYPSKVLFQAAYRTGPAETMARDYGFYTGNLFSTNYYQLMGEFVFGDVNSNHPLDHDGLTAKAAEAMPRAVQMVQNWVLEKQYIETFHDSKLTRSFKLRGIGGSEFEQEYANYFFNFYLSHMTGDFQYLPAFLLAKKSPIVNSASLQTARDLVARTYDYFNASLGTGDSMVKALYKIRNAVHNQLSKDVIGLIDNFDRAFPQYRREGNNDLFEVRAILVNYYSFGPEKLSAQAKKLGLGDIRQAADKIAKEGSTAENLLALSAVAAEWRTNIGNPSILEDAKRAQVLALVANACQLLNRELGQLKKPNNAAVEAVVNTVYAEGFLIEDNWKFFAQDARASATPAALLTDVIEVASGGEGSTLAEAFAPVYQQWVSVEPKMQYFMDNTIKSSSLATAAAVAEKVKQ